MKHLYRSKMCIPNKKFKKQKSKPFPVTFRILKEH